MWYSIIRYVLLRIIAKMTVSSLSVVCEEPIYLFQRKMNYIKKLSYNHISGGGRGGRVRGRGNELPLSTQNISSHLGRQVIPFLGLGSSLVKQLPL